MLRRRPDNTFEFRMVEAALEAARPAPLSAERRDALRTRIFASLGEQERGQPLIGFVPGERWIAIPAGVGIAAAIFAAIQLARETASMYQSPRTPLRVHASGSIEVNGLPASDAAAGDRIVARGNTWLTVKASYRIGLETGTAVRFEEEGDAVALHFESGRATLATAEASLLVQGSNWSAVLDPGSVATVASVRGATVFTVVEGLMAVTTEDGQQHDVHPFDAALFVPPPTGPAPDAPESTPPVLDIATGGPTGGDGSAPPDGSSSGANTPGGAGSPAAAGSDARHDHDRPETPGTASDPGDATSAGGGTTPAGAGEGGSSPVSGGPPADGTGSGTPPSAGGTPPADPPGHGTPPSDPGGGPPADPPGVGTPPASPGDEPPSGQPPADPPGKGTPPSDPGGGPPPEKPGKGTPPATAGGGGGGVSAASNAPGHAEGGVSAASVAPGHAADGASAASVAPGHADGGVSAASVAPGHADGAVAAASVAPGHAGDDLTDAIGDSSSTTADSPGHSGEGPGHTDAGAGDAAPGKSEAAPGKAKKA